MTTVSSNPALVEFPRDQWGFTTELRKYGLRVAGAIRGDEAKFQLFLETLTVLAKHAQARLEGDKADRLERVARLANSGRLTQAGISTVDAKEPTGE